MVSFPPGKEHSSLPLFHKTEAILQNVLVFTKSMKTCLFVQLSSKTTTSTQRWLAGYLLFYEEKGKKKGGGRPDEPLKW